MRTTGNGDGRRDDASATGWTAGGGSSSREDPAGVSWSSVCLLSKSEQNKNRAELNQGTVREMSDGGTRKETGQQRWRKKDDAALPAILHMKTRKFIQSAVHHPSVLQPPGAMAAKRPSTYTRMADHHPSPTGRYLQVPRSASSLSNPPSIRHKRPIAARIVGDSNRKTQVPPRTLPHPQAANLQLVAAQFSPPHPFPPMTSTDATTTSRSKVPTTRRFSHPCCW